jgi:hypothetical protein
MPKTTATSFSKRCDILGELWVQYKRDEEFADFFEYNDLGLPLAYAISQDYVLVRPQAEEFVNETFDLLLFALEIEDEGFETLDEVLSTDE